MALYKAEAIVLRVQPFGEADRLATLLSAAHGKIRAVAKGARRGRGLAAAVQPFVQAEMVLWQGRQLDGISQAEVRHPRRGLAAALETLAAAAYCCELAEGFATERQEAPELFAGLAAVLDALERQGPAGRVGELLRWCDLRMLAASGFSPELHACTACGRPLGEPPGPVAFSPEGGGLLCPDCAGGEPGAPPLAPTALRAIRHLAAVPAEGAERVRIGPRTMADIDRALRLQIQGILQRPLKSRSLLESRPSGGVP